MVKYVRQNEAMSKQTSQQQLHYCPPAHAQIMTKSRQILLG